MSKLLTKKRLWILIAALLVLAAAVTALVLLLPHSAGRIAAGDTTLRTDGNWNLTGEWSITRADSGEETLEVSAPEDSTAWNTFFNLADDWTVSADMQLLAANGASDCMRLVFGDANANVCMVVSVEFDGRDSVLLKADALTDGKWKNIYLADEWLPCAADAPLNLKVQRKGGEKYTLTLSQNDETLLEDKTKTVTERVADMILKPGLSVYGSQARFTSFAVAAKPRTATVEKDTAIVAGENVPTDEWILGENAVHNLINDESAIIIDGEGENSAWNAANTLGDEWTLSFYTEFGKSYRDSVCSRFMFGPEAAADGDYSGLITVNYANNEVMLQMESKEGGAWMSTGGSYSWLPIAGRAVTVTICKYKGINRIAAFLYDGDRLVYSTFSDEMSESAMNKYLHYGVMVYSSQVRFGKFTYTDTADESNMPPITERVFPKVSELNIGAAESTADWKLSKHSVFFRESGKSAIVIESKGEEFSYYTKKGLGKSWTISTKVEFGTYYSDTAGARVAFTNADADLAGLLTVKYSPSDGCIDMTMQTRTGDTWTDILKTGWEKGASSFYLTLSCDANGKLDIKITSAYDDSVMLDKSVEIPAEVLGRMTVAALATTMTQVKYSEIEMNLSGGAVTMTGGGDSSDKTMYALRYGTPAATSVWDTGSGMTYQSDGSLIVSSGSNLYSYNNAVEIADGFTASTDILFGALDAKGLSTARIALVDRYHSMVGLFTIKFSENFEIMVEGQYNNADTWYNCISDNAWRSVADNRLHVTVSRADGSNVCYLTIRDFSGKMVFSAACSMPGATAKKICNIGLGVDASMVKFSAISIKATAGENRDDFGMVAIEPTGTKLDASATWALDIGADCYSDGSLILDSASGVYATHKKAILTDAFRFTTKVQFGRLDAQGLSTARLALVDTTRAVVAQFTLKYSQNTEVMVEGQYLDGGNWTNILSDNEWRSVSNNIITATVAREAGSNILTLKLTDSAGKVFYSVSCTPLPETINRKIAGFALGCTGTQVKYADIQIDAPIDDSEYEEIVIGEISATADWKLGEGSLYTSDGSLIFYGAGKDAQAVSTAALGEQFALQTDMVFGSAGADGTTQAKLVLLDADGNDAVRITARYTTAHALTLYAQYLDGGTWKTLTGSSATLKTNRVKLLVGKADGVLHIAATVNGETVCTLDAAPIPAATLAQVHGFALGSYDSRVKFDHITVS